MEKGFKGKITIGGVTVLGMGNWAYSGATRDVEESKLFGNEYTEGEPLQITGGEVTASGNLKIADPGLVALEEAFDAGTKTKTIKLYINDNDYYEPDSAKGNWSDGTTGSYCIITKKPNSINHEASGTAKVDFTLKVCGDLKLVRGSATMVVETGEVVDIEATAAVLVGELVHDGGNDAIDVYFEYGTTQSLGDDTSADAKTLDAPGLFIADDELFITGTTYYYRAVAKKGATIVYGEIKSFVTL